MAGRSIERSEWIVSCWACTQKGGTAERRNGGITGNGASNGQWDIHGLYVDGLVGLGIEITGYTDTRTIR